MVLENATGNRIHAFSLVEEDTTVGDTTLRITSYNVCYTKLLRDSQDQRRAGKPAVDRYASIRRLAQALGLVLVALTERGDERRIA